MGRLKGRMKNVIITGIVICSLVFLWILSFTKEDGGYEALFQNKLANLKDRLRSADLLNRQRENDLHILHSQFNHLIQLMSQKKKTNLTAADDFPAMMNISGDNFSDQIGSLHLPSIFTYLPHLTDHPENLKPVYKLSNNRFGASIVMGIPTIRREKVQYLSQTIKSLIDGMTAEEREVCLIVVFVAEPWDLEYAKELGSQIKAEFPESVKSGLVEVISPPADFYPDLEHLKLTFGDTKERVRWRTKQNLDFTFLMLYARTRGFYYVQESQISDIFNNLFEH